MRTLDALIKNTHRLIRAPNLHLHKIRLSKTTRRTNRHGPIDILPCLLSAQDIIDFFTCGVGLLDLGHGDGLGVGAGGAGEVVGGGVGVDLEEGAVEGTEPHLRIVWRDSAKKDKGLYAL